MSDGAHQFRNQPNSIRPGIGMHQLCLGIRIELPASSETTVKPLIRQVSAFCMPAVPNTMDPFAQEEVGALSVLGEFVELSEGILHNEDVDQSCERC